MYGWIYKYMGRKYKGVERMVERTIDREIMDIVKRYVEVILANYKVKLLFYLDHMLKEPITKIAI